MSKEIDDLVCFNCPVPDLLKQNDCIHLSLGTQVKFFKPGEEMVLDIACLAKNRRISLQDCIGCPLYHPRGKVHGKDENRTAKVTIRLEPEELAELEPALMPPLRPIRQMNPLSELLPCDALPEYDEKSVAVCGYPSEAFLTLWEEVYNPVLRSDFNLSPVLVKLDEWCKDAQLISGARIALFDLSDLHPAVTLFLGMALGLGMPCLLFAQAAKAKTLEAEWNLPFFSYQNVDDLKEVLRTALASRLYEKKAS